MKRTNAIALAFAGVLIATTASASSPRDGLQAPRGQDVQAPRDDQDVQAPRGLSVQAARDEQDVQAPRGQDVRAPRIEVTRQ